MTKGFTRKFHPLALLTDEEAEAIPRGALHVLQKTGMRIEHERALRLFSEHGRQVDFDERQVRMPPGLVEKCLRQCSSSFLLQARRRDQDLMIGGNVFYFVQGMGMRQVDLETWETRPATAAEHREAMIVADALENTHLADAVFFHMERQGIPPVMVMLENLASGLANSSKAEIFGHQYGCEVFGIQMAEALGINLFPELGTAEGVLAEGAVHTTGS